MTIFKKKKKSCNKEKFIIDNWLFYNQLGKKNFLPSILL